MKPSNKVDCNLQHIKKGKLGCVFASLLAKDPSSVGWVRILNPRELEVPKDAFIVSYIFEGKNIEWVREWALNNGMYEEPTSENTTGLRLKCKEGISWVQYLGPDSHVKTRQTPNPELIMCVKLPTKYYYKVGFKGVLHLAHASIEHIRERHLKFLWDRSFVRTKEILGFKPTIFEAAKTTFKHER